MIRQYQLRYLKFKGMVRKYDTIVSIGKVPGLVLEICIAFLQPYRVFEEYTFSFYNDEFESYTTYRMNDLMCF
jgi:hypothetical protein